MIYRIICTDLSYADRSDGEVGRLRSLRAAKAALKEASKKYAAALQVLRRGKWVTLPRTSP